MDTIKLSDDEFKRIAIQKDYEPVVALLVAAL